MRIIFQTGKLIISGIQSDTFLEEYFNNREQEVYVEESHSVSGTSSDSVERPVLVSLDNNIGRYSKFPEIEFRIKIKVYKEMLLFVKESLKQRLLNIASKLPGIEEKRLLAASRMLCDESIAVISSFFENNTGFKSGKITDDDIELIIKFIHLENLQDMFVDLPIKCKILLPEEYKEVIDKQEDLCMGCKENRASSQCSVCNFARYCSKECQRNHWNCHKQECRELSSKRKV